MYTQIKWRTTKYKMERYVQNDINIVGLIVNGRMECHMEKENEVAQWPIYLLRFTEIAIQAANSMSGQ